MGDYSMNTGVPCEPRTMIELGFDNVPEGGSTNKATVPYCKPTPMEDATTMTSDTQRVPIGPAAGDITRRTRNG